jgi:hypothetical protein
MLQIKKTEVILFDNDMERARINAAFKGKIKESLLAILAAFETGDYPATNLLIRALNRDNREYVSFAICEIVAGSYEATLEHRTSHLAADGWVRATEKYELVVGETVQ